MKPVRIALVGLGAMGQTAHLRNYAITPDCKIVAAAELRQALGALVAARYGIPRVYTDHRELLSHESVDGIVAIQNFQHHGQLLPDLLARGIPVLIEKPLARDLAIAEEIVGCAARHGTPLYVAYHKRSDPAVLAATALIARWRDTGACGSLKYLRLTMPPGGWPSPATGHDTLLRTDEARPQLAPDPVPAGRDPADVARFDALVNYYIHQINLMRHLLGADFAVTYADPNGVVLALRGPGQVSGVIEMAPFSSAHEWQESAFVAFEHGWIRIDLPGPLAVDRPGRLTWFRDLPDGAGAETTEVSLPPIHAMRQQAIHFVKAIRGEATPLCPASEALKDLHTAREFLSLQQRTGTVSPS